VNGHDHDVHGGHDDYVHHGDAHGDGDYLLHSCFYNHDHGRDESHDYGFGGYAHHVDVHDDCV